MARSSKPLAERLWAKVHKTDSCWIWMGALTKGYGRVVLGGRCGKKLLAHRAVYELVRGPIPEGLTLDHLCRNRACVNPDHLEPVTVRENVLRGEGPHMVANRTGTCFRGHAFSEVGTYALTGGGKTCAVCARDRAREWRLANRERVLANRKARCAAQKEKANG